MFEKNGAILKINKKFICYLTRAKRTPSAAATAQVVYALIIILQYVNPGSHDTHPHDILWLSSFLRSFTLIGKHCWKVRNIIPHAEMRS
jgi:hypothetical protein